MISGAKISNPTPRSKWSTCSRLFVWKNVVVEGDYNWKIWNYVLLNYSSLITTILQINKVSSRVRLRLCISKDRISLCMETTISTGTESPQLKHWTRAPWTPPTWPQSWLLRPSLSLLLWKLPQPPYCTVIVKQPKGNQIKELLI